MKISHNLQNSIAKTLFIVLAMRCSETKKKNAIIEDITACGLVNRIDYDFSKFMKGISSVGGALRVRFFDNVVKAFIREKENPIVVIVGCELDTRYQRLGKFRHAFRILHYKIGN